MAEYSNEELLDQLGVEALPAKKTPHSAREERIIAGFEEIQSFVEEHGHPPAHGEDRDIFERLYATRLDQIRIQEDCRELVKGLDHQGLLAMASVTEEPSTDLKTDKELLAELGVSGAKENDITVLKHVKTRAEVKAAQEIANRTPCEDFDSFKPLFEKVQADLESGVREAKMLTKHAEINEGDLFVLYGQKVYVADAGEEFVTEYDRKDSRLRVIYDNGTESDLLMRSLQRALDRDDSGRRIVEITAGPLFSDIENEEEDLASGTIYVLRSKSDHPMVAENREIIHKIGVTGGSIEKRISNAKIDPTYLMSEVEIVASYNLFNINRTKLERLIHRFFESARLDIEISDRFGNPVKPQEWFMVPIFIIDEVVEKITNGSISDYMFDVEKCQLIQGKH